MTIFEFEQKVISENKRCIKINDFSDHWFEKTHNFIQVLFPNRVKGMARGPIVNNFMIEIVKNNHHTKRALEHVLQIMLSFYGYNKYNPEPENIKRRKYLNILNHTHNFLRISRMLKWDKLFSLYSDVIDFVKDFLKFCEELSEEEKKEYSNNLKMLEKSREEFWKTYLQTS